MGCNGSSAVGAGDSSPCRCGDGGGPGSGRRDARPAGGDNIRRIADAGADTFVAGSAIFGKPDYKSVIDEMRAALAR